MTRPAVIVGVLLLVALLLALVAWLLGPEPAAGAMLLAGAAAAQGARSTARARERIRREVETVPDTTEDERLRDARAEVDEVPLEELAARHGGRVRR